ncbi:MAG: peptide ABC transporter substrate-binding protein [Parachlamydiales bacterium]|nr:peptide ABC transporter substrate-binding protein [Parachlamydiales bacterium]
MVEPFVKELISPLNYECLPHDVEEMVQNAMGSNLGDPINFYSKDSSEKKGESYPNVPYVCYQIKKDRLVLYSVCKMYEDCEPIYFIKEMVKRHFLIKSTLISQKQFVFCHPDNSGYLTVIQADFLLIGIQKEKLDLEHFIREVRQGLKSPYLMTGLLTSKELTIEEKSLWIHHKLTSVCDKWPKFFNEMLLSKLHLFLIISGKEFRQIREVNHMCRIICAFDHHQQVLQKEIAEHGKTRRIRLKLALTQLHYSFGSKKVLGLIIALSFAKGYELFEERHILNALRRFIPHVIAIPQSFLCLQESHDGICEYYLEVEKKDETAFTLLEIQNLKKMLPDELKGCVEQLMPAVFMPRNEEEVMRNIMTLSRELRFVHDIPQVIISFQKQTSQNLVYNVVLLRILKDGEEDLSTLFRKVSAKVKFSREQTKTMGNVRKRYPKEANVFTLTFEKENYLRKDHTVDLYKARENVVSTLLSVIGDIRDYNGGLIIKQNQVLADVKLLLQDEEKEYEQFLETLFYSISPAITQSLLCPKIIKRLFNLFIDLFKYEEKRRENFIWKTYHQDDCVLVMIRAYDNSFVQKLFVQLQSLMDEESELVWTTFQVGDLSYLGFIFTNSDDAERLTFCRVIEQCLLNWSIQQGQEQVLRVCMQASPSSLHPCSGLDRTAEMIIKLLFEGLMRLGKDGKPEFAMAKSFDVSDDYKRYTFHLRLAFWSNGLKVKAYDFEYAWKSMLRPELAIPFSYLFDSIKNARLLKEGKCSIDDLGVHALDDDTLIVDLEHPNHYFHELTTLWLFSPICHEVDKLGPDWAYYPGDGYVCNGPFRLAEWKRHHTLQVIKSPSYWSANTINLERIDVTLVDDIYKALNLYDQNLVDYIGAPLVEIPLSRIKFPKTTDNVILSNPMSVHQCEFNTRLEPFTSAKVRQALSLALNRKKLVNETFCGQFKIPTGFLPTHLRISEKSYFDEIDHGIAKNLFLEGLLECGMTFETLPKLTMIVVQSEIRLEMSKAVVKQWYDVLGITVDIELLPWRVFLDRLSSKDFQMGVSTWYSWVQDPMYFLNFLRYPDYEMNASQWENKAFTELLNLADQISCPKKRLPFLQKAEEIIMQETPLFSIMNNTFQYMLKENINDVFISEIGKIDFLNASIGKKNITEPYLTKALWRGVREELVKSYTEYLPSKSAKLSQTNVSNLVKKRGFLRIAVKNDPSSLDPRIAGDRRSQAILFQLFEGLMRIDDEGHAIPALAEKVLISKDLCNYTFYLREAYWSNGELITADDFEYAWKKVLTPHFSSVYSYAFYVIKNAKKAKESQGSLDDVGVKALDDKTLHVSLEHPAPYFLECTANPIYSPINSRMDQKSGPWINPQEFICNGPFKLASWEIKKGLQLVKNPYYHDKAAVKLDGLVLTIISDDRKAWMLFEKGDLDWIGEPMSSLPVELVPQLHKEQRLGIYPAASVFWYLFNVKAPPFNHPKIRRAFGTAINRESIIKTVLQGGEKPALSILPQNLLLRQTPYLKDNDLQNARQLFEEGLNELGLDRSHLPKIIMSCTPRSQLVTQLVLQQLQEVFDLDMEIDCCYWTEHMDKLILREYQMASWGWDSWFNDPIYNLEYQKFRDNPINHTGWENLRYEALLNQSDLEIDIETRRQYLRKAEELLLDEMPILPLYYFANTFFKKERVKGVFSTPIGMVDFKWTYFD